MKGFFDVSTSKNREFWFGHLVILLATVFGVYLAASAGLNSAVEFELIKSDRDSYYMRTALLDEVQDNIQKLETWGGEYKGGNARKFMGNPDDFALDNFVWLTMQENPGTFEIPGVILTGIRRYYSNAAVTLRKMTSKKGAAEEVDMMLTDTAEFSKNTVSALEADVLVLRKRLEGMDFQL